MHSQPRATAFIAALFLAAITLAGCRRACAPVHILSLRALSNHVDERGVCVVSVDDGIPLLTEASGWPCITNLRTTGSVSKFLYFDVLDDELKSARAVYVVVRYLDVAKGKRLELHCDAGGDPYRQATLISGGAYRGTHRWLTAVFRMDAPAFGGHENGDADFRLAGSHLCLNALTISSNLKQASAALTNPETRAKP